MKYILSLFLLFSTSIFAQSELLTLFSGGIIYNGLELVTNEIDRTMETSSKYTSDFSVNANGWAILAGGTVAGNIDGILSEDDVLRFTSDGNTSVHVFSKSTGFTAAQKYKYSYDYYIPSSNTTLAKIKTMCGTASVTIDIGSNLDAWTNVSVSAYNPIGTSMHVYGLNAASVTSYAGTDGDVLYLKNIKVHQLPTYLDNGNHSLDSSSTYKQAGTYSGKIVASGAGNGTTNTISLASALFTAVTNGTNYRFQVYAYTSTANTTLTFKLGDITLTNIVPTTGMSVLNFDFKATASTTGNILLYLDKAATVYIDDISLKSGR